MQALSLFDGIGCGYQALKQCDIPVSKYYASEIHDPSIRVANRNHPEMINLWDARKVLSDHGDKLKNINLLLAGSPCQGFSSAAYGKLALERAGFDHDKSKLFFDFVDIKNTIKPDYFLLENVAMKKAWQDRISELVGVKPIKICSSLFSAQRRLRLYWTNIKIPKLPDRCDLVFNDIREYNYRGRLHVYMNEKTLNERVQKTIDRGYRKGFKLLGNHKVPALNCNNPHLTREDFYAVKDTYGYRFLTRLERERAQTLPDGYTSGITFNQACYATGNGWTVNVIAHILSGLK